MNIYQEFSTHNGFFALLCKHISQHHAAEGSGTGTGSEEKEFLQGNLMTSILMAECWTMVFAAYKMLKLWVFWLLTGLYKS